MTSDPYLWLSRSAAGAQRVLDTYAWGEELTIPRHLLKTAPVGRFNWIHGVRVTPADESLCDPDWTDDTRHNDPRRGQAKHINERR